MFYKDGTPNHSEIQSSSSGLENVSSWIGSRTQSASSSEDYEDVNHCNKEMYAYTCM